MSKVTELLLIRHGQTAWNKMKRLQGHSDIPLNEKGILQAITLGETLKQEPLDAIVSSDMMRALKTAEEIAKWHRLPVKVFEDLRERCYGAFEGMSHEEIAERYPESHAAWHAADPDHQFPPGERIAETMRQFHHRAVNAITRLAEEHAGKKIAVIAHFGIIEVAYRVAHGIDIGQGGRMPVLNTSINRFAVSQGEIKMLAWGEAGHLEPQQRQPVNYYKHF